MDLNDLPVESPEDWVNITDPDHVLRKYIDEGKWDGDAEGWWPVYGRHGHKAGDCSSARFRCRRKDLPAPARTPDKRPARDVILEIVQWLDPHPPGISKPQEALDCAEQWLVDNSVTPAVKRVPVRLWINEEDGWLFANPDQVLAADQEIRHDADGFYIVEESK